MSYIHIADEGETVLCVLGNHPLTWEGALRDLESFQAAASRFFESDSVPLAVAPADVDGSEEEETNVFFADNAVSAEPPRKAPKAE